MRGAVLALLLTGCGSLPALMAPVEAESLSDELNRTVLLADPGCTGVRIGGGLIVTAKHCLNDRAVGDKYSGYTIGYVSSAYDFMVLGNDTEIMPVSLEDALVGEHVTVIGYPLQIDDGLQQLTVTDGLFTGATSGYKQRITAAAYYGNSGGGVWNDTGGLVGIVVEIRPFEVGDQYPPIPFPAYSYMVPIKLIREKVVY